MVSNKSKQGGARLHEDDRAYLDANKLWKDNGQFLTPEVIANRLALELKELLDNNPEEIVDFGCGPGSLTQAIRDVFPDSMITGYDIDNDALRSFDRRFSSDDRIHSEDRNLLLEPLEAESTLAIISNPPYLLSRRLGRKMTKRLRDSGHFPVMSGKLNTFSLFIQSALKAMSPGAAAAFVVPIGIANLDDHHPLRELLMKMCDYIRITWCVDSIYFAEQGASVEVLLLSFRKRAPASTGTKLRVLEWDGRKVQSDSGVFRSKDFKVFPTQALLDAEKQEGVPIKKEFKIVARGFNWREGWELLQEQDPESWAEELLPIVRGSDIQVDGKLRSGLIKINYDMLKKRGMFSRTCDFDLHSSTRPRLLLADITSKIKVTYTTKPILPMNSVKVIFHKENNVDRLQDLLDYLGEETTFKRLKKGRPNLHLTKSNLETLLVPIGDA